MTKILTIIMVAVSSIMCFCGGLWLGQAVVADNVGLFWSGILMGGLGLGFEVFSAILAKELKENGD